MKKQPFSGKGSNNGAKKNQWIPLLIIIALALAAIAIQYLMMDINSALLGQ